MDWCYDANMRSIIDGAAGVGDLSPSFPSEIGMTIEARSQRISTLLPSEQRAELGQYMTPRPVADLMASMFDRLPAEVRLLDPGAGLGSLTAAFVSRAVAADLKPALISVTAYEIDSVLLPELRETLKMCARQCEGVGIRFAADVIEEDFVQVAAAAVKRASEPTFNRAILNPPYRKISTTSDARRSSQVLGVEVTNLYAAFVVAAVRSLAKGGELVAITPRSFCNGTYFAPFRKFLLRELSLDRIHVYESRKAAFRSDDVLQENVIFHGVRGLPTPDHVTLSISRAPGSDLSTRTVAFSRVVEPDDAAQFIRVASGLQFDYAAQAVRSLTARLSQLGIAVSTGRVVDFRAREFLRDGPDPGTVPLIYPMHFAEGRVEWPRDAARKPQALFVSGDTTDLLVPDGTYVLVRRFSAKEEKRRVVAAVYEGGSGSDQVAFENHLNYFHASGGPLERDVAWGLAIFLNSSIVDTYLREFSGHTQVNAADLRSLSYPTSGQLAQLGCDVTAMPGQVEIDARVSELITQLRD